MVDSVGLVGGDIEDGVVVGRAGSVPSFDEGLERKTEDIVVC